MHVFIDANVLLSFYRFSEEDVRELQKLVSLIDSKRITLVVSQQLVDEVERNRERTLSEILSVLRKLRFVAPTPAFFKPLPELRQLSASLKVSTERLDALLQVASDAIETRELGADKLIAALFDGSKVKDVSGSTYEAACRRQLLGNPPGKPQSLG
ncbi:MAG: PIN domain-containing protein, partial [Fimbriimonadaceae bacterium]